MIILKNWNNGEIHKFEITPFPDRTSQVWKINPKPEKWADWEIVWMFENEAEIFHVLQLLDLLHESGSDTITLNTPFLPFARQDKDISNTSTFALHTLFDLFDQRVDEWKMFDAHSDKVHKLNFMGGIEITNESPKDFFRSVIGKLPEDSIVCFPDKGAKLRYQSVFDSIDRKQIYFGKVRDQLTGEITGLKLEGGYHDDYNGKEVVIFDDLADGGMTFIKTAEALLQGKAAAVDLCVSHGLFTKGRQVLHDAGIRNIYTTNSLLRNRDGFKVVESIGGI